MAKIEVTDFILKEVPDQFVDYMVMKQISHDQFQENNRNMDLDQVLQMFNEKDT